MAGKTGLAALQRVFNALIEGNGYDRLLNQVKIVAGGNGSLTALMKVEEEHCNKGGFLHGGMTALLVDSITGVGSTTHPKLQAIGVSVVISVQYMKPAPLGGTILMKSYTDKIGGRMAFLSLDIYDQKTGDLVAKGTHTKCVG